MEKITRFYVGLQDKKMENQIKNPEEVLSFCKKTFEGFTAYEGRGGWKGSTENSLIIEVVDLENSIIDESLKAGIEESNKSEKEFLKESLEDLFNQESVMTVELMGDVQF